MDQESFRKLLQKPSSASSSTASAASSAHVRGSLLAAATTAKKKQKTVDASQPAFKPRTLKKGVKGETYRDRATERRLGVNNDYAQVEALAEDFERKNAENEDRQAVEEQRKYLGGDSKHTVLVKGLDFALLEQNRARVAAETAATEDVSLEDAFRESTALPKKRTKEEILRELKIKRGDSGAGSASSAPSKADKSLEEAKQAGKFRPIGSKPIGSSSTTAEGKVKRKKKVKAGEAEDTSERKKKKRKVAAGATTQPFAQSDVTVQLAGPSKAAGPETTSADPSIAHHPVPEAEPAPLDEDFDIFAGAGEYTGVDLGEDDESDEEGGARAAASQPRDDEEGEVRDSAPSRPGKWLATSDDEREPTPLPPAAHSSKSESRSMSPQRRAGPQHGPPPDEEEGEMEEGEERPMRLQPLASSALPSIKDLLAMSEEAEKEEKRRLRKEKKKKAGGGGGGGGGGGNSEKDTKAKVDRDYQRLKAYTDKKSKV